MRPRLLAALAVTVLFVLYIFCLILGIAVFPLLALAWAMAILIALSVLYLRSSSPSVNLERLRIMAKAHYLGNTAALRPFQKKLIQNPRDPAEYDGETLYEPEIVREHTFWPCVLCVFTVFAIAAILFVAFEMGLYTAPSMILGGASLGAQAAGCPGNTQVCPPEVQEAVSRFQLGSLQVMMYSFLAAYVWAIWQLFQRMVSRDVTVYAFHVITIRVVTTAILSLVIYRGIAAQPEVAAAVPTPADMVEQEGLLGLPFDGMILLAFAIGFFPETVLRSLANWARRRWLRSGQQTTYLDVEALEGVDTFTRARLAETGIIDAAQLATCNPLTLALKTPFSLQQVVDWMGQAQLLTLVKEVEFHRLRELGIRTSYQFYDLACENRVPARAIASPAGEPASPAEATAPASASPSDEASPPAQASPPVDICKTTLESDPAFARLVEVVDRLLGREARQVTPLQVAAE